MPEKSTGSLFVKLTTFALHVSACFVLASAASADNHLLPSWEDTASRARIIAFVTAVSDPGSDDFVAAAERVAVFDNDGTLWAEQPVYFQLLYAVDEARRKVAADPSLASKTPYKEVLQDDLAALAAGGHEALFALLFASHSGTSNRDFRESVARWLSTARHPSMNRPFTHMVYQPMLELLDYLRAKEFSVYIVSGGGTEFIRVWSNDVYGIPPERVIGSRVVMEYQDGDSPQLLRKAKIAHLDDGPGKPVGIQQMIGRRPILAGGNSDGDFEMLRWTTTESGPGLGMLIRHTDSEREWAYDRDSKIGRLTRGLDAADENGWLVVDMKRDWSTVFPE